MPFEPALHLYRSNRTERLVQALAELLDEAPGDPLVRECVVVQGRGMALWLMLELSRRHGISANTEFPFPRRFIERAFSAVLGPETMAPEATAPELLRWLVLSELPRTSNGPSSTSCALRRRRPDGDRTFQLAQQIARVFDQYITYRPELVLAWEREEDGELDGRGQSWQPVLWRALVRAHFGRPPGAARAQLSAAR